MYDESKLVDEIYLYYRKAFHKAHCQRLQAKVGIGDVVPESIIAFKMTAGKLGSVISLQT